MRNQLIALASFLLASFFSSAQVVADFSFSGTQCSGSTINFTNLSTGATSFEWDFGDFNTSTQTSPSHSYLFGNVYTVRLIARSGPIRDTAIKFVHISNPANANFWFSNFTGEYCEGAEVGINNFSQNYYRLHWEFGDGDTSNVRNVNHSWPSGTGTYNVTLIAYSECEHDTNTQLLEFKNDPSLAPTTFLTVFGSPFCPGEMIQFNEFSQQEDSLHFFWGDGSSSSSPSHAYSSVGSYDATLVAYNQCGTDSSVRTVEISTTSMSPFFVFPQPFGEVCPGDTVTLNSWAQLKQYLVNWGDGNLTTSTTMPMKHVYSQTGTYDIRILGENLCGARDTVEVDNYRVNNSVTPNVFFGAQPFNPCPMQNVNFNHFMNGLSFTVWKFGDGTVIVDSSAANTVSHAFASNGSYDVTLMAGNSCGNVDSTVRTITVGGGTTANAFFTTNAGFNGACYDTPVEFNAFDQSGTHYWEFGDGDTSHQVNPVHTYSGAGTYVAVHRLTNLCGNTAYRADDIVLNSSSNPNSTFNLSPSQACVGDSIRLTIGQFSTAGTGHYYVMGNGDFVLTNEDTAWYQYPGDGDFLIELIDTNACGFSYDSDSVHITPDPSMSFTFSPSNPNAGDTVWFTTTSSGTIFSDWKFDTLGGSLAQDPYFIFSEQGEYTVTLRGFTALGCEGKESQTVSVGPPAGLFELNRSWSLHPNPSTGIVRLSFEGEAPKQIRLSDLAGRELELDSTSESSIIHLNINHLPSGTYLLKFELGGKRVVEKVVLVR
jgi:PKD repeat protein